MKPRLRTTMRLAAFAAILSCAAINPAQARVADPTVSPGDADLYKEVKTAIEKYEASLNAEATTADLHSLTTTSGSVAAAKPVNEFAEILVQCDLLIKHDPKMPDYYRLRGKARYYKAVSNSPYMFIDSVSLTDPDFAARFSAADIAGGIKDLSDALTINPTAALGGLDAADAHLFRGKFYAVSAAKNYSKQSLQNALIDFDESVKLNGYDPPPDGFRQGISRLSTDGDLVGQDFARRIREDPSAARQIYLERARYLSRSVEYSKVLADLLRYANSPDANNATDKSIIGLTYATLNKYAGDAYKKANVSSAEEYVEKASLEIQFPEKQEDAFKDATEAVKRNSLLSSAHVIRAKVFIGKGQIDEGIAAANVALAQDADNVGALCIRALGFAIKNDIRTLDDFNRAILLDPELAFLYNAFGNRARIYTALGKADLAAADTRTSEQLARRLGEIRK